MAHRRSPWFLTLALCGGYFLVLLDVTVVNVALPQIGSGLGAGSAGLAWVVDAYSVPLGALLLASGAIGDRLGHRSVVLLGFAGFGAASVLCAVAPTIAVLIAARAIQGAGAALMLPGTLAVLVENAPDDSARARLVGAWAAIGGAALPAGPVIGGLLVQATGWRAVFWLGVPVIALALIPVARLPRTPATTSRDRTVNWSGAFLLVTGLACVVTAIMQAPQTPWPAGLLMLAALGIGACLIRVERTTKRPLLMVPPSARRTLTNACVVAGVMNLCSLGGLFLLTQILQNVRGLSPLLAGLATLPAMLPLPLLSALAGRLSAGIGVWQTSALGLLTSAAGLTGIAMSIGDTDYITLMFFLALWGAGLGVLTPAIVAAALDVTPDSPGVASGASNTSRQTGGALGVAIFAAIAGSPTGPDFIARSIGLFLAGAAVFALTCVLCFTTARRPMGARHV